MRYWVRGKRGGALAFAVIVLLVAGGLGWLTVQALQMEQDQLRAAQVAELDKARMERERQQARDKAQRQREEAEKHLQAEKDLNHRLQLAVSLLDSRLLPILVQEETRPYNHYSAVFATPAALTFVGGKWKPEVVLEPSPLLLADLPDWVLMHFQSDGGSSWTSPQVLSESFLKTLKQMSIEVAQPDRERQCERKVALAELNKNVAPKDLLAQLDPLSVWLNPPEKTLLPGSTTEGPGPVDPKLPQGSGLADTQSDDDKLLSKDGGRGKGSTRLNSEKKGNNEPNSIYDQRMSQYSRVQEETNKQLQDKIDPKILARNIHNEDWFAFGMIRPSPGSSVSVWRGQMVRLWLKLSDGQDCLVVARRVRVGTTLICQGIVIDWRRLQSILETEINDIFPDASFAPLREDTPSLPDRTMSALPIVLNPHETVSQVTSTEDEGTTNVEDGEPPPLPRLGWTPLRIGLGLTWAAALIALTAVGLGGWSLLDLSERRIRFVSAVTHELRTPLTTLRLYLDMLTGGMVKDDKTRDEYLKTLDLETDRLNRLILNVLDFSRLENQQPRLELTTVGITDLLDQISGVWQKRCEGAGKELVIENLAGSEMVLQTDVSLLQQVVGNLIDNACKYSRDAADRRIVLRARPTGSQRLSLEVEDHGPGIPPSEARTIFQPFRRGQSADVTAGGVGLGLALARRWTQVLGGNLTLAAARESTGARFVVELATVTA